MGEKSYTLRSYIILHSTNYAFKLNFTKDIFDDAIFKLLSSMTDSKASRVHTSKYKVHASLLYFFQIQLANHNCSNIQQIIIVSIIIEAKDNFSTLKSLNNLT